MALWPEREGKVWLHEGSSTPQIPQSLPSALHKLGQGYGSWQRGVGESGCVRCDWGRFGVRTLCGRELSLFSISMLMSGV
jgi:hypothetical protein